ncbi:MAG: glycosyltransferase family 4 protein [Opitutae bacterium]|nr:glycosyltransferase family 4 protein [Opitutae bacterium]
MRTLLLSPELFLAEGGIARIMRLYLKALCELAGAGDEVSSLVLNDQPGPEPRLARYSSPALRTHTGCARGKLRFIGETLRLASGADRIICGHLHQLPIAWLAKKLHPALDYFLVAHGIEVWRPYSFLEQRALLGARRIWCVSDYTRRQLLRFCPALDVARLVVVPNALDPFFQPDAAATRSAAVESHPRILTVARLAATDTYKGIDTLIEALPLVRREHPGATLRIVGGGDDLPRLQALAARVGVETAVSFAGSIGDEALRGEYAACDLFALPSRKEGFGLVFLEAMTHGKSCLGARAGGVPEVLNDEVGALAEYGNIPNIAAAVSDLLRYPRDPVRIRAHAGSFAFPRFKQRLAAALI